MVWRLLRQYLFNFQLQVLILCGRKKLTITSTGCLASVGGWFTPNYIEWTGGESVAKVISGSKLWLIANELETCKTLFKLETLDSVFDLLTKEDARRYKGKVSIERKIFYHLSEPNDLIVQPSFSVHCVFTEPNNSERKMWSLVTGFEAVDIRCLLRGPRLFNKFVTEVDRVLIKREVA